MTRRRPAHGGGEIPDFSERVTDNELFGTSTGARTTRPTTWMTELLNAEFEDEHGVRRRLLTREEVLTTIGLLSGAGNETHPAVGWTGKVLGPRSSSPTAASTPRPSRSPAALEAPLG